MASKSECLVRGAKVGFEVSNGGIVPRRLVVELFLDCLVCIGFSCLRFAFCFGFSGVSVVVPVHLDKAERPAETRHDCAVFFDRLRPSCKNPSIVLELRRRAACMTTPSSTRQEVTQLLGDWRRGSTREVVPAGAT